MLVGIRSQGTRGGHGTNPSMNRVRSRRAMRPDIEMLEWRALLATLQFVEPGSVVGAQLAIGDQTNAQTASPGKPSLEAHANITVDDASGNGVTVNGTPYTTYSDDGVASADLENVGSSSFSVQNDLTLAGGYPLTVSDQIGTSTGAEGSVPGSFVTLEIVPDSSDPVNMSYQINLSANYTSSQEPYLYYNAPDTYGDLNSHFIVAYKTEDSSGTFLDKPPIVDKTIGQTDRGGPTGDAGSTGGQGSASFTVGADEPFQIQVADLMEGTLGSEAYFTQVFLNPSVSDQLQVGLTWQPTTLPDIALNSATTTDAQNVSLNYSISGADISQPFQVAVYRSPTQSFSVSTAVPLGIQATIPAVDTSGNPSTGQGQHSVVVTLPTAIGPDTGGQDPYVFVVANPPGSGHIPESDDPSDANDVAPLALPLADVQVDGTSDPSDDITLLDPGVIEQPIPVLVTNTGTGTSLFQIEVTPASAGYVDQTSLTLAPNQSATVTFVPQAVSKSANDVSIDAIADGEIVGSGSLTVVSVTLPQDIRNLDTPAAMPDRIPPTAVTPIDVQVTPDLSGSGQSITLAVNNQDASNGTVTIDGGDTLDLTSSGIVSLSGLTQTAPAADGSLSASNAGKLDLVVQVRGQDTVLSNGFSVAAIMTGMTATFDMAVTRGKTRGVDVEYSYVSDDGSEAVSDSGPEADLSALKIKEIVTSTKSGVFKKKKAQPVYNLKYVNPFPPGGLIDQHEIDKALISSPGGLLTSSQAFVFEDSRTGATGVPVTNSGFITTQRVFQAIVRTARRRSVKRFELQTIIAGSATDPDGVSVSAGTTMDQSVPQAISRILTD
jgi:hypothetical protein